MPSVLFVFTLTTKTLSAHLYYVLAPHATIDIASPNGANPPVDEGSVKMFENDPESLKFLANETIKGQAHQCQEAPRMFDLPVDPVNIKLANEFYRPGKIVSAVCHGVAALVGVTDTQGKSIFAGKNVTGFSNAEEEILSKTKDVPFSTEDRIISLGGKYTKADKPF
ncbi:ThiJ/PfpI [Mycena albidolilacea]|uniref:ThiJ/PfpI n=1 Tax=Mycena albidolilacea TaxID=1033008 RepID=A0AAD7AGT0_9AGAR|nr:ThiJ/PfpI [Mycena albidolilacea]